MTRNTAAQLLLAALLLAGGAILRGRAGDAGRLAGAHRALLTLQYARASDASETSPAASYWTGDYGSVPASVDPLLAANAAYRAAVAPGGTAKDVVTRLDDVVKRYAEVLRNDPANEDAAFNYEFVVRYRSAIAARGLAVAPEDADTGSTPHGRVGAPPKGSDQRQFRMLVPMRPDERREAEEAGKTGRRIRKG